MCPWAAHEWSTCAMSFLRTVSSSVGNDSSPVSSSIDMHRP
jgi:hypothetical protein